jgi:hypothetical protein
MTSQMLLPLLQEKATCEKLLTELESGQGKYSPNLNEDLNFAIEQVKVRIQTINKELQLQK